MRMPTQEEIDRAEYETDREMRLQRGVLILVILAAVLVVVVGFLQPDHPAGGPGVDEVQCDPMAYAADC